MSASTPEPQIPPPTAALADLFASPPGPSRRPPPSNPEPLFFSPGSAIDTPRPRQVSTNKRISAPSPPPPPAFQSLQDDYDLPPDLDFDDEEAEAAGDNARREFDTRQVDGIFRGLTQAGGDFGQMMDPFAALDAPAGDTPDGGEKKRRVMAKVDGDRLMGSDGMTALMKRAKRFKVRGKGRETEDLAELMNMYQLWAHGMFPKGDFSSTIHRVEVICRSRRMESALKGYRDAFYPRPPTPPPLDEDAAEQTSPRQSPSRESPVGSQPPESDSGHDRDTPQPLFTPLDPGDEMEGMEEMDDGPDLDELAALEAAEMDEQGQGVGGGREGGQKKTTPQVEEEEDEWEHMYD